MQNCFQNHEISRRLKVSEANVRRIKKKIESREELSPKRKKKYDRKPIFTSRSERFLKKICLENRKPKLTLAMKAKRLHWARQRCDKDVDFRRSTVKHPTKIRIWSVISGKGTGRLYAVKGMMRQDQYKDVLQNRLIPMLEE
ncbi:uncharacterized protein TNCV_1036761 [Trichonephila clavipes]|nr:uncharacterized protein TNCV_1036761 [Trichonephila clavipes]